MLKYLGTIIESGIFDKLDKSEYIKAIEELELTEKKKSAGSIVFCEGEPIDALCIVAKGTIYGERVSYAGNIHILQEYGEGAILGLDAAFSSFKTVPMDYVCSEDSIILNLSLEKINHSSCGSQILRALMEHLADENIRKLYKIELLAERNLRKRILIYFEILSQKSGGKAFYVRMNREELAQYLCVNKSALSSELNKMKREGIIDFHKDKYQLL